MIFKKIVNDLDIRRQADELGLKIWQAPSFLLLLMGVITVIIMMVVYFISRGYQSPEALIISESLVVIIIFSVGNFIIKDIEQMAKINKMKSEFISIASHQLKNPLSNSNWELELLLSKYSAGLSEKQLEIIKAIVLTNTRMVRLVSDLLDVARIDQGRFKLDKQNFNIKDIVEEVIENNRFLLYSNNVKIEKKISSEIPEIYGDRRRIAVVVDNLFSNALKYASLNQQGKIEIIVKNENKKLIMCVKDNGIGIPSYQQKDVFQKFFRSDNVVHYQTEGTGLGLYISKNIVEQSGGKIWFVSKEGVESSFCFSLPIENKA